MIQNGRDVPVNASGALLSKDGKLLTCHFRSSSQNVTCAIDITSATRATAHLDITLDDPGNDSFITYVVLVPLKVDVAPASTGTGPGTIGG